MTNQLPRELMESCCAAAQDATFDGFDDSVLKAEFADPKRRRLMEAIYRMGFESGWRIREQHIARGVPASIADVPPAAAPLTERQLGLMWLDLSACGVKLTLNEFVNVARLVEQATARALGVKPPVAPSHATKENGDCPHWCKACALEREQRDAGVGTGVAPIHDPLRQAAEQFLASCKDSNVAGLIDYYEEIFTEALGVPPSDGGRDASK